MTSLALSLKSAAVGRVFSLLVMLASARWTVLFFLLTAAASLAVTYELTSATALMTVPFVLLVVNLLASLLVHARFRTDIPLLVFHIALLLLVVLLVVARLIYLDARATVTSSTAFNGELQMLEKGPLHQGRLDELHFFNEGFTEDFYLGGKGRQKSTYNKIRWQDSTGLWHSAKIGDDHPLLLNGYRIYTTHRRGYSPVFQWQANNGQSANIPTIGTVQLSAATDESFLPTNSWTLPDGPEVWALLEHQTMENQPLGKRVALGAKKLEHTLVLRIRDERYVLNPGESIALPEGKLTYLRLDSWMGYLISYDPTIPWVMSTIVIGVISLIWFYWRRIF